MAVWREDVAGGMTDSVGCLAACVLIDWAGKRKSTAFFFFFKLRHSSLSSGHKTLRNVVVFDISSLVSVTVEIH